MTDPLDLLFESPADELSGLIAEIRWMTLRHPVAARSAVRALVAEGRRFAMTEEGKHWKARLARSELVHRGQVVWDVGTLGALDGAEDHLIPTQLIDAFARASARRDLESAVSRRIEIDDGDAT